MPSHLTRISSAFDFATKPQTFGFSKVVILGLMLMLFISTAKADDTGGDPPLRFNCYVDNDNDGYGAPGSTVNCPDASCSCQPNLADNDLDCDDNNPNVHPGANDVPCDGID